MRLFIILHRHLVYLFPRYLSLRHRLRHRARHRPRSPAPAHRRRQGHPQSRRLSLCSECHHRCKRRIRNSASTHRRLPLEVSATGFAASTQEITLASGTNPVLHIPLAVAQATQSVVVEADTSSALRFGHRHAHHAHHAPDDRPDPRRHPHHGHGDDHRLRARRLHDPRHAAHARRPPDKLAHRRHRRSPTPRSPRMSARRSTPKTSTQLETQRGSYAADIGDRTYGVFNVLPRNGFECNRDAELLLTGGNLYTGEAQLSLGDHSARTAWYASLTGSRSNYGLATPVAGIYHDATNSQSGFVSLLRNQTRERSTPPRRAVSPGLFPDSLRPEPERLGAAVRATTTLTGCAMGRPSATASSIANWVHTLSPKALFEFAPFYHFNQSNYDSPANDYPVATTWHQTSNYAGRPSRRAPQMLGRNSFSGGVYSSTRARTISSACWSTMTATLTHRAQHDLQRQRRIVRVLHCRSSAPRPLCHAARRRALLRLPCRIR